MKNISNKEKNIILKKLDEILNINPSVQRTIEKHIKQNNNYHNLLHDIDLIIAKNYKKELMYAITSKNFDNNVLNDKNIPTIRMNIGGDKYDINLSEVDIDIAKYRNYLHDFFKNKSIFYKFTKIIVEYFK